MTADALLLRLAEHLQTSHGAAAGGTVQKLRELAGDGFIKNTEIDVPTQRVRDTTGRETGTPRPASLG